MRKLGYIITFIIIVLALAFPFMNTDKKVDVKTIEKVVDQKMDVKTMQKQEEKALKRSYKVKLNEYEKAYSYGPLSYMNVEEISVFYQPDEKKREVLLQKAEDHITAQINIFEGYGEVQTKLLKKAYVGSKGEYVICIVSNQVHEISDALIELF